MKTATEQHRLTLSFRREIYYKLTILDPAYSPKDVARGLEDRTLDRDGNGDEMGATGLVRTASNYRNGFAAEKVVAQYSYDDDEYVEGDDWEADANWYDDSAD